jgi:hypothetical protein
MIDFSPKERAVAIDRARTDFWFYVRWKMLQRHGRRWIRGPHHAVICNALMRVYLGEWLRVIINIPPRYSKTQLIEDFISWTLGRHPDSEYMYLSYGALLAADKTGEIRADVQHPCYREIFPEVHLATEGQGHWKTTAGGVVYASGTGGTITGLGAGKMREGFGGALIYDDPHKPDEVYSEDIREKVKRNFQDTGESRLNWRHTPIIVIMQGLHEEDITQWLLAGGNGEKWERVCLPAINEDGTALWPEKHSIEDLRRMQAAKPYTFSGQYMQRPTPLGGSFFTEAKLLVDGKPVPTPQRVDFVFAIIDTAVKTGKKNDGLAVTYFARSILNSINTPLAVLDYDLKQIEGALLEVWLPNVFKYLEELAKECQAFKGSAGALIEDKTSGSVLLQQARNKHLPARPIDSKLTSLGKSERAINCEGYVYGDQVKFTERAYNRVVTYKGITKNHLLAQILRFSAATGDQGSDDALDTFTYGCALSLGNSKGF